MSLKAQIKARLKAKFPGVNLSTKRMDAIADKLKFEDDVEDTVIDERLDELNDIFPFADIAKSDDRLRTLEAKQKKEDVADPDIADPTPPTPPDPDPDKNQVPEWAKGLISGLQGLQTEISTIKTAKTGETRKSQLEAKLKDSDSKFKDRELKAFGRMKFETDEDFDTYLTEVEEAAKEFVQTEADQGLGGIPRPASGTGGAAAKVASKEELDAVMSII